MSVHIDKSTILKYDVAGPRYTSYPTAPQWSGDVHEETYKEKLHSFGKSDKTLSLYVHIPFCEQLCYFCACMKVIRRKEERYGDEYLDAVFKEIELVARAIGRKSVVRQLHWGGGTPTFLNENQIERLFKKISAFFDIDEQGELAVEIDPRSVTPDKIRLLRALGFNRVSMGVQDFDDNVMRSVNRVQSFDLVRSVTEECRRAGFHSVNFDLIYGLPKQTRATFIKTVDDVIVLKPDRIALYSFAYVPWLQKQQAKLNQKDFPDRDAKLDIFLLAREMFLKKDYQAIAMDHFALTSDEMARAFNERRLYRNFMGYTVKPADEYIGLGVSSIGFLENTFVQNIKELPQYIQTLGQGKLPVERGRELTNDDRLRRWVILQLMCHFHVDKNQFHNLFKIPFDDYFKLEREHLDICRTDGLIDENAFVLEVTPLGQLFIRNICMGFDAYLKNKTQQQQFSKTI